MLQAFFFPVTLSACSKLSMCLSALLSTQQTSDGGSACCCYALQVGTQAAELRLPVLTLIYLSPPSTGALVPGSEMIFCPAGRWVVSVAQNIPCVLLLCVEQTSMPFCWAWGRGSLLSFHQQDISKYFFRIFFSFP